MPAWLPTLVGRGDVLTMVRDRFDDARAGVGSCLLLTGPAGIGKTRLLTEVERLANEAGFTVAAGHATELDGAAPLSTLLSTLRPVLPPEFEGAAPDGPVRRYGLVDRLGDAVEVQARSRPLVVAIDDVQWADELSASALRLLVPLLVSSPVLWLLTRRSTHPRSPGQDAANALVRAGAAELHLPPLNPDEIALMCAELLGGPPDATVLALAARSGGSPFLLEQLLLAVRDGSHVPAESATLAGTDELPPALLAAVAQRLRVLSPATRRLLEAGSVFRRPFTVHSVAALIGEHPGAVLPLVDEATRSGVLTSSGAELTFDHDLLRQAVYDDMPSVSRSVLHREAAVVVRAEGHSAVEVVEHLIRGGAGGEGFVPLLREAVSLVADDAPDAAADLMVRALPLADPHDDRPELVGEAVRLMASCGRLVEARQLGETALQAGLTAATEARLLLGLAEALKHAGDNAAVVDYTRRALERDGVPDALRAQLMAVRSHAELCLNDMAAADRTGELATELGTASGETSSAVFGILARSVVARARGDLRAAVDHARVAVRLADEAGGAVRHRHPRLWLASALVAIDEHDEAEQHFLADRRELDQLGTAWARPLWHYFRSSLQLGAGRLDDAAAEAEAGMRIIEQLSALQLAGPLWGVLVRVATRRDELPAAAATLERAAAARTIEVPSEELPWARALLQETTGDLSGAMRTLAGLFDWSPRQALLLSTEPEAAPALVRIARAVAEPRFAASAADAARRLARANPGVASFEGTAEHAEGLLHDDPARLRAAVATLRSSPRRLALAAALEDSGRAEVRAGDRETGLQGFTEALEAYARCGARRDAARVQKQLRELGVRRRGAGAGLAAAASGRLTPSELRVALLVTEGLSNRQVADRLYLSPHTVDSHLRHAFTKLGLRSRVELTRLLLAGGR